MELSVVIPSLNEEATIEETLKQVWEGIRLAGGSGEIVVVDSSSDRTAQIAEACGARVIRSPKKGLGQAYIDAVPHLRGKYIVMGDADCTYDFREIPLFTQKLAEGYEYVMGTRTRGVIERGAMPWLHRYFGNPVTTWLLNVLVNTRFSDIHCGLRAMTAEALRRIDIQSPSWEYASEMVLKSGLLKLKSCEIPIHFYRDKPGRQSHHRRLGWFSPWYAGWLNVKIMLLYAPDKTIIQPGFAFLAAGLALIFLQVRGPVALGRITLSTNFMLLGLTVAILGFSCIQMGVLSLTFSECNRFHRSRMTAVLLDHFTYRNGVVLGAVFVAGGLFLTSSLAAEWVRNGFRLAHLPWYSVTGFMFIVFGIQTLLFTLVYQAFLLGRQSRGS